MGTVIGDLLPLAVGVAISPIPIVAIILVILSDRAASSGTGFAVGWVAGIALGTTIVVLLAGGFTGTGDQEPSPAVAWTKIVLGVLLVVLAASQWRGRSDDTTPRWMQAIDELTPVKALGLGAVLAVVNPKNLLLCVSAGVAIGTSGLGAGGKTGAVVIFTVLAAATVLAVVLGYLLAADRLRGTLGRARNWLQANNHAVLAIVLLVMGTVVLGKGIGGL
ncbi:GAP family protein [Nocardia sp. BMG51109]|uniref:GAP family protein n=1 Tax=Nocardia sp. BMG51109 TaxID=1056816 RepID=UPI0004670534|nr:GAP family protein [Nocardia sp. BMG51109]